MKCGVIGGALGAFIYIIITPSNVFEGFNWDEVDKTECANEGGGSCIIWDDRRYQSRVRKCISHLQRS